MHTLTVYISDECWSCQETRRILTDITPHFTHLLVRLVDTRQEPLPDDVFAIPTYRLDGKIVWLGNPTREALQNRLNALFSSDATTRTAPEK
jgi:hypothetical protein